MIHHSADDEQVRPALGDAADDGGVAVSFS
jgi:hypothetical protein